MFYFKYNARKWSVADKDFLAKLEKKMDEERKID